MDKQGIGFFADPHSNRQGMMKMDEIIRRYPKIDWYCGGDLVGWFFQPIAVVQLLMRLMKDGLVKGLVLGNHEHMALNVFEDEPTQVDRKKATAFSAGALEAVPEVRSFLMQFLRQHTIDLGNAVVCHHCPYRPPGNELPTREDFKYLPTDLHEHLGNWTRDQRVILSGHDHTPRVHTISADLADPTMNDVTSAEQDKNVDEWVIPIEPNRRYWVQVGASGGPPRGSFPVPKVHYVVLNPGESITMYREAYDTTELEADILAHQNSHSGQIWKDVLTLVREWRGR